MSLEMNTLLAVSGVGPSIVQALIDGGYRSLEQVKGTPAEELTAVKGIGAATAAAILEFLANASGATEAVQTYRYDEKRKNIPPAGLAAQGKIEERPKVRYSYDPHLPPVLRFDGTGKADALPELLQEAQQRPLTAEEIQMLAEALRTQQPWLEWAGKREQRWFEVDPVALHLHERVSAEAIIATARKEQVQRSLFADPELEYREAVKFYDYDVPIDWANRLILGDSLVVMNSLAKREDLAGKVQMIYVDPPYGIKFASNFQPFVGQREVKDRDQDLTREPEQVRAYRDTWTLGVHSYLAYLRERLIAAKELLANSGSIFVQISDENVHRVRDLLDEVFMPENFCAQITLTKAASQSSSLLASVNDFLLWYAKDVGQVKYRQVYSDRPPVDDPAFRYICIETPGGDVVDLTFAQKSGQAPVPEGEYLRLVTVTSQTGSENSRTPYEFAGQTFVPPGARGWSTNKLGLDRLNLAGRLYSFGKTLSYKRYHRDTPILAINNLWNDVRSGGFQDQKIYVVQTQSGIVARCMFMTTDPGDLVLDPTCGSGTTAYVAEQWGRRWITVDTSRVAVALARQRLMTAQYEYYAKEHPAQPLHPDHNQFVYRSVPYITLKAIAQNQALDPIFAEWEPVLAEKLAALNGALATVTPLLRTRLQQKLLAKEKAEGKRSVTDADRRRWELPRTAWQEWEVPFDSDPEWPQPLQDALTAYRAAWRQKTEIVNATIAASVIPETLVDQPEVVKEIVRVSGPFTVEGVQPPEQMLDLDSPIGGEPEELETFGGDSGGDEAINAEAYLSNMIRLLRQDGVRFPNNQEVKFDRLEALPNSILHAEGEWHAGDERRRVAVAFGPQYGPITAKQVEDCLWAASRGGFDVLVFAGFTFDAAAQAAIQDDPNPRVRCHMANIRPDVNMGDLLKETPNSQLFTVFGLPRVAATKNSDGEWVVTMEGVDIYDPATNSVQATRAEKVAAWFLDGDYDGRTFCITQAFFPDRNAWDKLARALKSVVDPERFAAFSGVQSLPFRAGKHKRAAVKVIDPRGNEVMRLIDLGGEVRYG